MHRTIYWFALFVMMTSNVAAQDDGSSVPSATDCSLSRIELHFVAEVTWIGSSPCVEYTLSDSSPQTCEGQEVACCQFEAGPRQPNCSEQHTELEITADSTMPTTVSFLVQGGGAQLAGPAGEQVLRPFTFLTDTDANTLALSYAAGEADYGSFAVGGIGITLCLSQAPGSKPICGAYPTLVTKSPINIGE